MKSPKFKLSAEGGRGLMTNAVMLFIFLVLMAGSYIYLGGQDDDDREYLSLVGQQRVLSQRLTTYVGLTSRGTPATLPGIFNQLEDYHRQFTDALRLIKAGDPETGMSPSDDPEVMNSLSQVDALWKEYGGHVQTIIDSRGVVVALHKIAKVINDGEGELLALADEVAANMSVGGASKEQVYIATRQLMLSQRIIFNVNRMLEGGEGAVTAADRFGRDAAQFGRILHALMEGDRNLHVRQVQDEHVLEQLEELTDLFDMSNVQVGGILERSPEMFKVSAAQQGAVTLSDALLAALTSLEENYQLSMENRTMSSTVANVFGFGAVVMLIVLGFQLYRESQTRVVETERRRQEIEETNRRNQQAIMRLLDEMGDLADGDLTVNVTVTEDVTGAIADSINFAIEALRNLVETINETAGKVSGSAQSARATAIQLAESSDHQAQQITSASTAVNEMAVSIEGVSKNADELAEEAQRSVAIAKQGSEAVQNTIRGMDTIREHIQETSKRIKRLGESSQEIGEIVELINDIAEQTNILSLNAAIQAAMAGEAGRGFAVVADEVQRLAERSADATKQIEALVKTIQTDTNEAVISMEESTAGVVEGARLAEEAGTSLSEIDSVSIHLAELVQSISDATRRQASAAANISDTMNVIQEITSQTSTGTNQTAESIGHLAQMADELKESVAGFKLPE